MKSFHCIVIDMKISMLQVHMTHQIFVASLTLGACARVTVLELSLTLGACARVTVLGLSFAVHRAAEISDQFYALAKL